MAVSAATSWSTYSTAGVLNRSLGADTSGSWTKSTSTSELAQQGEHGILCPVTDSPRVNWVATHVGAAATLVGVARLSGVGRSATATRGLNYASKALPGNDLRGLFRCEGLATAVRPSNRGRRSWITLRLAPRHYPVNLILARTRRLVKL